VKLSKWLESLIMAVRKMDSAYTELGHIKKAWLKQYGRAAWMVLILTIMAIGSAGALIVLMVLDVVRVCT